MKNFKSSLILSLSVAMSSSVFADIGIGVSVQNDDSRIYVPVDITESFRVEPVVRYYKNNSDESDYKTSREITELGVGFFKKNRLAENLNFLVGGRVSYLASKQTYKSEFSDDKADVDGYAIAPTIGFEYFVLDQFSIGGEAALSYSNLEGEDKDSGDKEDLENTTLTTDTSLNVRFYF